MAEIDDQDISPEVAGNSQAAVPASVPSTSAPEQSNTMLDIHAPHVSVHTWKDFFIHLATISIGLLIAIGLEQSVEYVHHRHQVKQMLESLRAETIENHSVVLLNLEETDRVITAANANLLALETINNGQDKSPFVATPLPNWIGYVPGDTTWLMMRDSGLLPIVPELLVKNYFKIEATLAALDRWKWLVEGARQQLDAARKVQALPQVLSPQEREALQRLYGEYEVALVNYRRVAKEVDVVYSMALANEPINPEAGRQHGFGSTD